MRCTDCEFMKETIPTQMYFVFCTKYRIERSTLYHFDKCPEESKEDI